MSIESFNGMPDAEASAWLERCCVSERWIAGLLSQRPFASAAALLTASDKLWATLEEPDYLQAFEGHPKIGDVTSLKARYANTSAVAASEQSGVAAADDALIARLAQGNDRYLKRFGFIFIVCASGKSAQEMTDLLEARLTNERAQELLIAAEEQRKIMHLRLEKQL